MNGPATAEASTISFPSRWGLRSTRPHSVWRCSPSFWSSISPTRAVTRWPYSTVAAWAATNCRRCWRSTVTCSCRPKSPLKMSWKRKSCAASPSSALPAKTTASTAFSRRCTASLMSASPCSRTAIWLPPCTADCRCQRRCCWMRRPKTKSSASRPTNPKKTPWPAPWLKNVTPRRSKHEPGTLRHPPLRPIEYRRLQPRPVPPGKPAVGVRGQQPGQIRLDQRPAVPDSGAHVGHELRQVQPGAVAQVLLRQRHQLYPRRSHAAPRPPCNRRGRARPGRRLRPPVLRLSGHAGSGALPEERHLPASTRAVQRAGTRRHQGLRAETRRAAPPAGRWAHLDSAGPDPDPAALHQRAEPEDLPRAVYQPAAYARNHRGQA